MTFDITICEGCYWYNKAYCEAEYNKKAIEVYYKCHKHLEKYIGQMTIDDLLREEADNETD